MNVVGRLRIKGASLTGKRDCLEDRRVGETVVGKGGSREGRWIGIDGNGRGWIEIWQK